MSKAELMIPAPVPDLLPRNLVASTTAGENTKAIPAPTMNLRTATSAMAVEVEVPRTAIDEMNMPMVTVFFGPCFAASIPPGNCIAPTPR